MPLLMGPWIAQNPESVPFYFQRISPESGLLGRIGMVPRSALGLLAGAGCLNGGPWQRFNTEKACRRAEQRGRECEDSLLERAVAVEERQLSFTHRLNRRTIATLEKFTKPKLQDWSSRTSRQLGAVTSRFMKFITGRS